MFCFVVSCATNYNTLVTCLRHLATVSVSFSLIVGTLQALGPHSFAELSQTRFLLAACYPAPFSTTGRLEGACLDRLGEEGNVWILSQEARRFHGHLWRWQAAKAQMTLDHFWKPSRITHVHQEKGKSLRVTEGDLVDLELSLRQLSHLRHSGCPYYVLVNIL